jgi:hypothetical protein
MVDGSKSVIWREEVLVAALVETRTKLGAWQPKTPNFRPHNAISPLKKNRY